MTEIPQAECNELVNLYNSTNGPGWTYNEGWLTTNTPCSWYGITCSAGHVSKINLGGYDSGVKNNNLNGTIPNLKLPNLAYLDLSSNQLNGSIPDFNLPNLEHLNLSQNKLSGSIPNFNLPNLKLLYLWDNQLSGTIPNFNLPNLMYLDLGTNQLSGTIPDFNNLPNLTMLLIRSNQLSGSIPNFNLPALRVLYLPNNQLSGTIPNLNWSSFYTRGLSNNCGLVAFDTAQATVLNRTDPGWQTLNPVCNGATLTPTATPMPILTLTSSKAYLPIIIK